MAPDLNIMPGISDLLGGFWREALTGLITVVILPLIYSFIKRRWWPDDPQKKSPPKVQQEKLSMAAGIIDRIRATRVRFSASRVYVSALHNGSKLGIADLHYEKLSVVYEATDAVTLPTFGVIKDYPVLQFAPVILSLVGDGRHHRSMHDEPVGSESRLALSSFSVHDEYIVPLRNKDNTVVGLLGVQYHNERHPFTEDDWATLTQLAQFIEDAMYAIAKSNNGGSSGVISWK